ncbi:PA0069 family radical SAM protein [Thermomonas sp. S9]|uniref:PA0069 family radical SAM protein n=1 Tax=Thermomonas sp. S9 TaxID=2885203 RepID=UPI001AC9E536|nr:PA0069 family radical SAM protein [Thermomonas sp. S9]MBN8717738.1 PA0069 family radical SAM protein [Xanthomonadales bacterium]MBN8769289.1 PA0069 family radical SAM protein [Stenotrophomonas sp.]MCR6495088.1 PA0069 family radical SAM protein [Thermomonas sp. S9]
MVIASSPPSSDDDARRAPAPIHGRGAASHLAGRFARQQACAEDDGWGSAHAAQADAPALRTEVRVERARRVISRNQSPDIGLRQSVNPYRGCEHGCAYCFARPSHAYLDLSPGLDFETRLFAKTNTAEVLRTELARPGYVPAPIALGINTDGWQPIERRYGISRACLEVLREARHPVSIVSKGSALRRDLDLLAALAREGLVHVYISVTTLDNRLSARLEPRAAAPQARLRLIAALREVGVPVGVLVAPVIPALTDADLERILIAAREAGAQAAGYVLLRLPHELKALWRQWLQAHYPERAERVMHLLQQMHGGRDYDARFGHRQRGSGPLADLLAQRFGKTCARLGYSVLPPLRTDLFVPPRPPSPQGTLF